MLYNRQRNTDKGQTQSSYKAYLQRRLRMGNWFSLPRDFLLVMSARQAVCLAHLLNAGQARSDERGWLMCTTSWLEEGIGLSPDKQDRVLAALEAKGFVELQYRTRARWVRVNVERIERAITKAQREAS